MADSNTLRIVASSDNRCYGRYADGSYTAPVSTDALSIGALVANPTTDNGAWPMADLVKMSQGWTDNGGTGTFTIDEKEHVVIDGTRELTRIICLDFLQTFPRAGTYTVFRTGTADLRVFAGGVDSGWQSTDTWTFTAAPGQSISLYVRSPDGNSATLTGAGIVHSTDVAAYQANPTALSLGWASYIGVDMNSPIIRNVLPHEVFEDEFARRTTEDSLSFVSVLDRDTFLQSELGSRHSTFSLETQARMVNDLGASTFYWNIPPHASNDWVLQAATLIHATLNPTIRVAIALTNESWNDLFWYNAQVIRTIHITKDTFTTTPGSNTWTRTNHGYTNGQNITCIVSPNSARQAGSGPYHASGDPYPAPVLTRMQVTNATTDTFDVVRQSDGTTPLPAPAGVTEVYAWLETAYDLDGANYNTQVDNAHGLRSSQMFDIAVPVFAGRDTVRLIETQSDFISRTQERVGVNGANGNYDAISLGLYYNAADVWQVGDTEADMEADGIVAAEAVVQAAIVGHINAGFTPENIWSYEAGPHWLAILGSNGTQQQREDAFEAFASTQGMANTEEYFYGRCQELGLRNMVITSPDLYIFGSAGTWGSKSELYLPDIPRTTLYKSWQGAIQPPTAITTNEFYIAGHSLATYEGGSTAPSTAYTNMGNWLGLLAAHNNVESSGGYTFGQVTSINAYNWADLSTVPVTGTYPQGNTRTWDTGAGGLQDQNLDRYFFMPSNFLEVDVGGPPFNGNEAVFQGVIEQFITNMSLNWPNAEKILYIHCPDGAHYTSNDDMTPTQFTNFVNDTLGDYLDWFIDVQNLVNANNTYDIKAFPVYPVMLWIIENESYLSTTTFSDYFGDSSPHGTETAFFLMALVVYRCLYRVSPDVTGFTFPVGTTVISEVQNNLSAIVSAIDTRVLFHNANGVNVL